MRILNDVSEVIGNTPLVRLARGARKCDVVAKLESKNPGGSVKGRTSLSMIGEAEKQGIIKRDTIIIEPTSGNTGIGRPCNDCRCEGLSPNS